jgi:hypothetical protein
MQQIAIYDRVKIVKLIEKERYYSGTEGTMRPPAVGDTGTVVNIDCPPDGDDLYDVEAVAPNGFTIWLAAFRRDEIAPI